jgi:hypothetical protein
MRRLTYRSFCSSRTHCGLDLSPLMAAVIDASEGVRPNTIDDSTSLAHFGCDLDGLPTEPRRTIAARSGGRSGKTSRLLATKALHAAWTVPAPLARKREVLYCLLVAPDRELGRQALSFVSDYVQESRFLSRALVEETKDYVEIKRPLDGRRVRIAVVAASRGGRGARGRTLLFAGLDEAAFFYDETTGIINDSDIYRAVTQRVVPGGQVWIVSTPWLADVGLLESTIAKNWGTHETALVCTSGTRALNPTWDPTGEIECDMRQTDPDAAVREIDGEPMAGGAGTFFDWTAIQASMDDSLHLPVPPRSGARVAFGADLAFVSDSSALVGAAAVEGVIEIVTIEEIRPTKGTPLRPRAVIDCFADTLKVYRAREFVADHHYRESAREHLQPHGIQFINAPSGADGKLETYLLLKKLFAEARIRIPNHPRLLSQLRSVIARPQPGGGTQISIPRRRGAGHGDLVSALVLAAWRAHTRRGTYASPEARAAASLAQIARLNGSTSPVFSNSSGSVGRSPDIEHRLLGFEGVGEHAGFEPLHGQPLSALLASQITQR